MSADRPNRMAGLAKYRKVVGAVFGFGLFAAALVVLFRDTDGLSQAAEKVSGAPLWLLAAAVLLPMLNWLSVTGAFVVLIPRYVPPDGKQVDIGEMAALVGSAWLLNYLPLRPGLVARVAYHKTVNKVLARDSARMLVESGALTGVAVTTLLAIAVLMMNAPGTTALIVSSVAPLGVTGLAWAVLGLSGSPLWRYAAALEFKLLDMAIWVARYAVVFSLVGAPLDASRTVLVAAISQFVLLVPLTGNGLGIREWGVALAAEAGLQADVLNRAAETLAVLPVGIISTWWVARKLAKHRGQADTEEARSPDPGNARGGTVVSEPEGNAP
ncbi:MAG: hypothetical protein AAGI53_00975 [Planctomycetota bacterium]